MSNMIHGTVYYTTRPPLGDFDSDWTRYCLDNEFAIHFLSLHHNISTGKGTIVFELADSFVAHCCENFMDIVLYTVDGHPILDPIHKDLGKLKGLVQKIFDFKSVEMVELRFSFGEVIEEDYEICKTNLDGMTNVILSKYLEEATQVPTIKVMIEK
ncbi:MAG: hypothetical protein IJW92_05955 [Clostridia bacterium]|nr:hypothetical protein [Clostridia bacterium]